MVWVILCDEAGDVALGSCLSSLVAKSLKSLEGGSQSLPLGGSSIYCFSIFVGDITEQ